MKNIQTASRRDVLRSISIGMTAPVLGLTDTTELYHRPPPDAAQSVIPLDGNNLKWVNPDEWPVHYFGYTTEGEEGKPALEKVRSGASYSFQLNGKEVTDFDQGWTGVKPLGDDRLQLEWRYSVPPLPAGEHSYKLTIEFSDPIWTRGNPDRVWEGEYQFQGTYTVPDRVSKDQSESEQTSIVMDESSTQGRQGRKPRGHRGELRTVEIDDSELFRRE